MWDSVEDCGSLSNWAARPVVNKSDFPEGGWM